MEIINRFTKAVIFGGDYKTTRECVLAAIGSGANLSGANLYGANLSGADLSGANLSGADLSGADLSGANLSGADLSGANLSGADLYGANLSGANLYGANLYGANLYGANLSGANLYGANLYGANLSGANLSRAYLSGANLSGANLSGANLSGANLSGANGIPLIAIAKTRILPEGDIIGWKKVRIAGGHGIIKLQIPSDAKRSHAFGRKCRCQFAKVLEAPTGAFTYDHGPRTEYIMGEIVRADDWDEDFTNECSHGIHFFITREEAEGYQI